MTIVPHMICVMNKRRLVGSSSSDPSKAERELGWKAEFGIEEMCRDSWNWQRKNPEGYR